MEGNLKDISSHLSLDFLNNQISIITTLVANWKRLSLWRNWMSTANGENWSLFCQSFSFHWILVPPQWFLSYVVQTYYLTSYLFLFRRFWFRYQYLNIILYSQFLYLHLVRAYFRFRRNVSTFFQVYRSYLFFSYFCKCTGWPW